MLVVPISNSTSRLNIGTDDRIEGRAGREELRLEALGAAFRAIDERPFAADGRGGQRGQHCNGNGTDLQTAIDQRLHRAPRASVWSEQRERMLADGRLRGNGSAASRARRVQADARGDRDVEAFDGAGQRDADSRSQVRA